MSSNNAAGSPLPGEPAFLAVGRLRRAHGLRGEMLIEVLTDFPERLKPGVQLYWGEQHTSLQVTNVRHYHNGLLLTFAGYSTPEAVGELRNQVLYVRADTLPPLEAGEFYQHQMLGLRVIAQGGQELGRVEQILETGANDVLVVRPPAGPEVLIPLVEAFIRQVDLEAGELHVEVIPGMLSAEG